MVWRGGVFSCLCESGFSVYMAGPGICVLYLADTCASSVHPVQSSCTLWISASTVYLFIADIGNPDLFVCGCRTWICLDVTRFYEAILIVIV